MTEHAVGTAGGRKTTVNYRKGMQSKQVFTRLNLKYLVKIAELMQDLLRHQTTGHT